MTEKHTALDVAKYIVNYANELDSKITIVGLQMILYLVQVEFIKNGEPLFADEIEAWKWGPVVDRVYTYFREFSDYPIPRVHKPYAIFGKEVDQIKEVVNSHIFKDEWVLAEEVCQDGTPWHQAFHREVNKKHQRNIISHSSIKNFL